MIPTFHSGNQGKVSVGSGNTAVDLATITWTLTLTARYGDTTASDTSGIERWQKVVTGGNGTFKVLWDSTQIPDVDPADPVQEGTDCVLALYMGDSGKFYTFTAAIETVTPSVDNQNGIVVFDASFKFNGAVTRPVT